MAEIKISEMTQATTMAGDEIIPIVQGGLNKFATQDLLKSLKVDDAAPTAENGSLWFSPAEGKLYVKIDGDWVDVTELTLSNTTQYHASDIVFVPQGDIAATDVQAAIVELDTEKASNITVATKADKAFAVAMGAALG